MRIASYTYTSGNMRTIHFFHPDDFRLSIIDIDIQRNTLWINFDNVYTVHLFVPYKFTFLIIIELLFLKSNSRKRDYNQIN